MVPPAEEGFADGVPCGRSPHAREIPRFARAFWSPLTRQAKQPWQVATLCFLILGAANVRALADVAWVEPEAIAKTTADALAAADPTKAGPGGATRAAYVNKSTDIAAVRKMFDEGVAKAGLTIIDDPGGSVDAERGFAVTVEDAKGRRAIVRMGEHNGEIVVVPRPTKWPLASACVALPQPVWNATVHASGIDQEGERHSRDITWRLSTSRLLDVDGDAILDGFVPNHGARQCPEEGTWDVYVMRGTCGHAMGTIGPGWFGLEAQLVPLDRSGYRPLTTASEHTRHGARGIPEMVTTTTVHKVKRKAYRAASTKQRVGVCHHCSVWHCTTP